MAVINISGSVWSSLHFDNSCYDGDQEGFLIGEVVYRETMNISDSQINRKTEEVDINITSHHPCTEPFSFYDTKGHVDQAKMLALLRSNYKNVIGFYRFRRNTLLQPSLREISLYRRLLASLPGGAHPDTFVLAVFSCSSSLNEATHSYPYQLYTHSYTGFVARSVSIVNLGDTAESEYKLSPVQASMTAGSAGFQQILSNYSTQLLGQDATLTGVQTIQSLTTDIHTKLKEVKDKVCSTEGRLRTISEEVYELRRRAQRQRQDKLERDRAAAEQNLNTNNNTDLFGVQPSLSQTRDPHLPVAMETQPSSSVSKVSSAAPAFPSESKPSKPPSKLPHTDQRRAPNSQPSSPDPRDNPFSDAKAAKPGDPFAGLIVDMKQSLSKSRSSSMNSSGKDSSSSDGPVQKQLDGTESRSYDLKEAAEVRSSSATSGPQSQEGSHSQTLADPGADVDVDDDETQIDDEQYYQPTLSPTF